MGTVAPTLQDRIVGLPSNTAGRANVGTPNDSLLSNDASRTNMYGPNQHRPGADPRVCFDPDPTGFRIQNHAGINLGPLFKTDWCIPENMDPRRDRGGGHVCYATAQSMMEQIQQIPWGIQRPHLDHLGSRGILNFGHITISPRLKNLFLSVCRQQHTILRNHMLTDFWQQSGIWFHPAGGDHQTDRRGWPRRLKDILLATHRHALEGTIQTVLHPRQNRPTGPMAGPQRAMGRQAAHVVRAVVNHGNRW